MLFMPPAGRVSAIRSRLRIILRISVMLVFKLSVKLSLGPSTTVSFSACPMPRFSKPWVSSTMQLLSPSMKSAVMPSVTASAAREISLSCLASAISRQLLRTASIFAPPERVPAEVLFPIRGRSMKSFTALPSAMPFRKATSAGVPPFRVKLRRTISPLIRALNSVSKYVLTSSSLLGTSFSFVVTASSLSFEPAPEPSVSSNSKVGSGISNLNNSLIRFIRIS